MASSVAIHAVAPETLSLNATHADYYDNGGSTTITVRANDTTTQDFTLLHRRFGRIQGSVRDAATLAPITRGFLDFSAGGSKSIAPTGTVLSDPLGVPYPGVPAPTNVRFSPFDTSYWSETVTTILRPDETVTVDIAALRRCAGAIVSGTVVNALTQAPIPNARTSWGPTIEESVFTDAQGQYVTPELPVGFKNGPNQIQLGASAAGFNPQSSIITAFCGGHITVDFGRPATGVGNIEGHVTNADTGSPLSGIQP